MDKEKLKQQAAQAQQLLLERTKTAYEGSKSLLRASHVINQYVSIVAGGLVAVSAVLAIIDILYKIGSTKNWFWGILTQVYIVAFGVAIIVLEVPIVERTKPVMAFKVFVDRWLRALSRLTARGIVYFTHAVLIIDAQHEFSRLGEFCGYFLFGAGIFSALVGCARARRGAPAAPRQRAARSGLRAPALRPACGAALAPAARPAGTPRRTTF